MNIDEYNVKKNILLEKLNNGEKLRQDEEYFLCTTSLQDFIDKEKYGDIYSKLNWCIICNKYEKFIKECHPNADIYLKITELHRKNNIVFYQSDEEFDMISRMMCDESRNDYLEWVDRK